MLKETLTKLIEDPKVYYIYDLGASVWNVEGESDFYVIVDNDWKNSENVDAHIYTIKDWFQKVMSGELIPWICACLNKKFIYKEHVKLMMKTDPLQLRKYFDRLKKEILNNLHGDINEQRVLLWQVLRAAKLINQIIENHKIVNFNSSAADYQILCKEESFDNLITKFTEILHPEYELLCKSTDGLLQKEKTLKWEKQRKT